MKGLFTAIGRLFSATEADRNVGYYQYQMNHIPKEYGLCSDRNCPCPETVIPKGTGYLYISPDAVTFMKMMMAGNENNFTTGPMPVLVCKEGAELRGLNLRVAGDDAKLWWAEGRVPLRPTPLK